MDGATIAEDRRLLFSLMLLTFVTGLVDAASVLGLGRVFTANMTGNVVFLGLALGGAADLSIPASLVALAGFLFGAAVGGRLTRSDALRALRLVLALEIVLLLVAAGVAAVADERQTVPRGALLVLLSVPMGLQNAAVRRLAVPDLTTTVLTLTLTGIAADSPLAGGTNPRLLRRVGAVLVMLAGAFIGASLLRRGLAWTIGAAGVLDAIVLAAVLAGTVSRRSG
jgi:uncharacterized membrane protein YoaK (UPF0700 family)